MHEARRFLLLPLDKRGAAALEGLNRFYTFRGSKKLVESPLERSAIEKNRHTPVFQRRSHTLYLSFTAASKIHLESKY